jgi:hypothetical protein
MASQSPRLGARRRTVVLDPVFSVKFHTQPPLDLGQTPLGRRVISYIAGGWFKGPRLVGEVLPGGADWVRVRRDGALILDVRATLRTEAGSLIEMTYGGRWITPAANRAAIFDPVLGPEIDPSTYALRTNPLFDTSATECLWLNDVVAIGFGRAVTGGVRYDVWSVP